MTVYVDDADFTLHHGDVLDVLPTLPDQSVHCVITSPPYWGLRDYGTGTWDGGNPDCDHDVQRWEGPKQTQGAQSGHASAADRLARSVCRCGATRVDRQLGLEETPDEYVGRMVDVFRQIRRVLRDDGTLWLNIGDSYAANVGGKPDGADTKGGVAGHVPNAWGGGSQSPVKRPDWLKPKDLVGVPWRVAFALQADGWYLRSDIIWAKPNAMPESVTDRPTKAHEYVFLLSKQQRYWFDQEAVREPHSPDGRLVTRVVGQDGSIQHRDGERWPNGGRNVRSVWEIATQPYAEAHFATYPQELVRRCLLAGCPEWVCGTCGKPRERIILATAPDGRSAVMRGGKAYDENGVPLAGDNMIDPGVRGSFNSGGGGSGTLRRETAGWSDCGHDNYQPGTVLDPFMGSGTTAFVARHHGRRSIGVELNADYCQLAAKRLSQQSLLAGEAA